LDGQGGSYLAPHQLQVGLAYRSLTAGQWFVGEDVREDKAPFGQPLFLNINSIDLTLSYGLSDRLNVSVTVPFSYGTHSRYYGDNARHKVKAGGLGDVNLMGSFWLLDPVRHADGNVAVSLGVKAPTGKNDVEDDFFLANGSVVQRPVDQSIQLGDGGWGFLLQAQAFQKLFENGYGYANGSYLLSPKNTTEIGSPLPGVPLSVPDVYSGRLGFIYTLPFAPALSVGFGGRVDGIPIRDVSGESDGFRRPAVIGYADPSLGVSLGPYTLTVNVPVRVYADFRPGLLDREFDFAGGGDLAKYLFFFGIDRRF
jgi:hypothetical protein